MLLAAESLRNEEIAARLKMTLQFRRLADGVLVSPNMDWEVLRRTRREAAGFPPSAHGSGPGL